MKPIFSTPRLLGLHATGFALAAIVLMFFDSYFPFFSNIRSTIFTAIAPIQYTVSIPITSAKSVAADLVSKSDLMRENTTLRAQQLLLLSKLQKLLAVEQENANLRGLAQSINASKERFLIAQLLAVNIDDFNQKIVLDKGKDDGVYIGQPVLDAYGLMGQVILTGMHTNITLLITDSKSAIPVKVMRNGSRSILIGTGNGNPLELIHVSETEDIKRGDLLLTSGLGGKFPEGYPVGIVNRITHNQGDSFLKILVTPCAHINQAEQVLLTWPQQSHMLSKSQSTEKALNNAKKHKQS